MGNTYASPNIKTKNVYELLNFLKDPENDTWNPSMTIHTVYINDDVGRPMSIPIPVYNDLKKVLRERYKRIYKHDFDQSGPWICTLI